MTISSSLNAGVMGLTANATRLGTISDNIANSATHGYKRVEADFHSMVIGANSGSYSAGGVRATTQRLIDERGPLLATNNSTDLAVRGRGMLPVTSEVAVEVNDGTYPMMLSTTGSFRPDADGFLKSEAGLVLMGWPAESDQTIAAYPRDTADGLQPVQLNLNQVAGEPTTNMHLGVNLPATSTESTSDGTPENLSVEYFDNLGKSEKVSVSFTPTVPVAGSSNEWTMVITDSASGGATIGEYTLTFADDRTDGGTMASVATISGGAYDPLTGTVEVSVAGGPISIDIGELNDPQGITQLSDTFAPGSITKDGSSAANLTDVEIDSAGYVHALFDIGVSRIVYQIPLVDVPNPNGLITLDSQAYQVSDQSGSYFLWDAGEGPTGEVVGFAREESATDVATELTELIQTQRAYSSNAKVIQTVDEMLQETTNIKR